MQTDSLETLTAPPAVVGALCDVDLNGGTAARSGPALSGLIGWRPRTPMGNTLTLANAASPYFDQWVRASQGYNPFEIATTAGTLSLPREVQDDFVELLGTLNEQHVVIALFVPVLPVQPRIEAAVEQHGVRVVAVHAPNAYVVKGSVHAMRSLAGDPFRHWLGQTPPALKIDPRLAAELGIRSTEALPDRSEVEPGKAVVALYDAADLARVQQAVELLGGCVDRVDAMTTTLEVSFADAAVVIALARMQEVSFIDARRIVELHLDTSVRSSGNHAYIRDNYTYGSTVTLGMIDSGFEIDHLAFKGQGPWPVLHALGWNVSGEGTQWNDNPTGHGTHVGGILLSRWRGAHLDGMAPLSGGDVNHRFRVVRVGLDSTPNAFVNMNEAMDILARDNGAEVINCSWGIETNTGTDAVSIKADAVVWDTRQTYVFSAGNAENAGAGSIGSPGAAKNVITVGNVEDDRRRASSSCEGPTADGRTKPDIYAPGTFITSADAANLERPIDMTGTSMAAPHVTGFLATLMGHYPSLLRHPATAKAYLMASAERATGLPDRTGTLNSYEAHFATSRTGGAWGWGDTDPRGFSYSYWDIRVPSGVTTMVVVLTWIEPAPALGARSAVYNDIDLWVDYNKDNGDFGEWSSTSIADNLEVIRISEPRAGEYRIKARNFKASVDYRPGLGVFYRM